MTIYAATSNKGKLAEFADSASGDGVQVLALPGLPAMPEPVEDASTFIGNAELKAIAYSLLAPGLLVFADDSGLCVDALGGMPGVRSARFADDANFRAGSGARTDDRNNELLLERLRDTPASAKRTAQFVCALSLAQDGHVLLRAEGHCAGQVLQEARGHGGFGYDPLFLLPELGLTMAEVTREQKWQISHRGKAFRELLRQALERL